MKLFGLKNQITISKNITNFPRLYLSNNHIKHAFWIITYVYKTSLQSYNEFVFYTSIIYTDQFEITRFFFLLGIFFCWVTRTFNLLPLGFLIWLQKIKNDLWTGNTSHDAVDYLPSQRKVTFNVNHPPAIVKNKLISKNER